MFFFKNFYETTFSHLIQIPPRDSKITLICLSDVPKFNYECLKFKEISLSEVRVKIVVKWFSVHKVPPSTFNTQTNINKMSGVLFYFKIHYFMIQLFHESRKRIALWKLYVTWKIRFVHHHGLQSALKRGLPISATFAAPIHPNGRIIVPFWTSRKNRPKMISAGMSASLKMLKPITKLKLVP